MVEKGKDPQQFGSEENSQKILIKNELKIKYIQ
jgi:hypothetical protein